MKYYCFPYIYKSQYIPNLFIEPEVRHNKSSYKQLCGILLK